MSEWASEWALWIERVRAARTFHVSKPARVAVNGCVGRAVDFETFMFLITVVASSIIKIYMSYSTFMCVF